MAEQQNVKNSVNRGNRNISVLGYFMLCSCTMKLVNVISLTWLNWQKLQNK